MGSHRVLVDVGAPARPAGEQEMAVPDLGLVGDEHLPGTGLYQPDLFTNALSHVLGAPSP